jgi:Methyltransferase FkbM domain
MWLPDLGSIVTNDTVRKPEFISVQSFPIYSILLALSRTNVDFFSLDVEGYELDVLRTIPWSKVNIRVNTTKNFNDLVLTKFFSNF